MPISWGQTPKAPPASRDPIVDLLRHARRRRPHGLPRVPRVSHVPPTDIAVRKATRVVIVSVIDNGNDNTVSPGVNTRQDVTDTSPVGRARRQRDRTEMASDMTDQAEPGHGGLR